MKMIRSSATIIAALALTSVLSIERAAAQQPKSELTDADRAYTLPDGVTTRDVTFYSEGTACQGKLFLPKGFTNSSSAPAVVLVPEWISTAKDVEKFAAKLAGAGIVAMPIDYRGWGKSGAFVRLSESVWTDDRLRFHPMTTKVTFRRGRLIPEYQIEDIRNAISYLQGEPGINPQAIGVWAAGESAGNVVAMVQRDGRAKAAVLSAPIIPGKDAPWKAAELKGPLQEDAIRRARTGKSADMPSDKPSKKSLNSETKQALAEFHPYRLIGVMPETFAVLIVSAEKDELANNAEVAAAEGSIKGPHKTVSLAGATHYATYVGDAFEKGATAAVDWFKEHLK